jgi:hypothetical protein
MKSVAFSDSLRGPYVNGTVVATHNVSGASCYNAVSNAHPSFFYHFGDEAT